MWNLLSELWVEYFIGEDWLTHCRLIYSYTFQRETKKKKDAMRAMGHPCCHLSMPITVELDHTRKPTNIF